MRFRHRITGMIVTSDRVLSERRYERLDVDDLEELLAQIEAEVARVSDEEE